MFLLLHLPIDEEQLGCSRLYCLGSQLLAVWPSQLTCVFVLCTPGNKGLQCFTETLGKNTLVVGSYKAGDTSLTSQGLYVSVTSPSQKSEYSKSNEDSGKFAFTSSEDGNYKVCFTNKCKQSPWVPRRQEPRQFWSQAFAGSQLSNHENGMQAV